MAEKTHITHVRTVAIPVTDQDRALDFYVGTLGFEKRMDATFGGGPALDRGSAARLVDEHRAGPAEARAAVDRRGHRHPPRDEDAEADHAELRPRASRWTPRSCTCEGAPPMFSLRDPDGNLLYVVEMMEQAA